MFNVARYDPSVEKRESRRSKFQNRPRKNATGRGCIVASKETGHGKIKAKKRRRAQGSSGLSKPFETAVRVSDGVDVKTALISRKQVPGITPIPEDMIKDTEESRLPDSYIGQAVRSYPKEEQDRKATNDSSSSVPHSRSDGDKDREWDGKGHKSTLRVIAPEQKPALASTGRRGMRLTDEGIDDFDVENNDDLIEGKDLASVQEARTGVDDASISNQPSHHDLEIATALRTSSLPIVEAAEVWDLAPFLVENLKRDGYERFFPIQSLVIPDVIASERYAHVRSRDICVSAPTGSGKTLAFVLPVLNSLSKQKLRRLRALVVLPSRDLATQVHKVFARYTDGSDLRVGLAIGQTSFEIEQQSLILGPPTLSKMGDLDEARLRHLFNPTNVETALQAFPAITGTCTSTTDATMPLLKGGRSAVDVLVATPGRLMDHLEKTPGFTLQHLRFLVIDEADRLVNQSYQNWIGRVVDATMTGTASEQSALRNASSKERCGVRMAHSAPPLKVLQNGTAFDIDPITWRRGWGVEDGGGFDTNDTLSSVAAEVYQPVQLRKLLYSATLTKDPQRLASLGLVNPKHFDAHHLLPRKCDRGGSATGASFTGNSHLQKYSVPKGLSEFTVECTAQQKPLVLLALLLEQIKHFHGGKTGIVVVFTSSLDSTHRLARLLQMLWDAAGYGKASSIAEFSSALNQKQRSKLLLRCNGSRGSNSDTQQAVSVIVCSDGMSRGMDLPSVCAVINYDVPSYAKTYIHRCGRTARAGREGTAISVLKGGQVRQFMRMRKLIDDPDRVKPMGVVKDLVRHAMPIYQACIRSLRRVIEAEKDGELDAVAPLSPGWIPPRNVASQSGNESVVPPGALREI